MRIILLVVFLVGCTPTKRVNPEPQVITIQRTVACSVKSVAIPEFQPVTFTTLIIEGTAWVGLTPVEHGSLQTNHARLVGYGRELQAELKQVQACIDRHNKDSK